MKFEVLSAAVALLVCGLPSAASAQEKKINPWQDCGLGAMVFPENGTAAAISNVIWDLGTTAVSSKISSPDSCEGERVKAAMIIQRSYAQISIETAVGHGEHLDALADLYQCSPAARPALVADLRSSMSRALSEPNFAQGETAAKAERFFADFETSVESGFSDSCSIG